MHKRMSRILACFVAVALALGSVCYRPPKAEAAVLPSALAVASVVAVMCATGFELNQEGTATGAIADALEREVRSKMKEYAETREMYQEQFEEAIASRVELLADGTMRIGYEAANLINSFAEWLVAKFGLIDENGIPVTGPVLLNSGVPDFDELLSKLYNKSDLLVLRDNAYTSSSNLYEYHVLDSYFAFHLYDFIYDSLSNTLTITPDDPNGNVRYYGLGYTSTSGWVRYTNDMLEKPSVSYDLDLYSIAYISSCDIYDTEGNLCSLTVPDVSISLSSDYEAAPTVEEQYAMVIDTGLTMDDEQSIIDSILSGAVAGTLAPSYAIEQAPAGDLVVPDEDTTQASILSWVKTIAQSVVSLPQSIAKAVEAVFAPDAALVDEISATFTDKFGFVSTLHQLGTDLLSIDASSAPPVVYIHLEDAEGTINYGGTCKALDMSWYARYKEDGDRIMSGFLWIGFLWLLFKRASAIIQGAEMATDYGVDIHDGFRFRGERNGKHF